MRLPIGKIPPHVLREKVFSRIGYKRKDVVVGAGIGMDSAVLRVNKEYIVATTDPITAATNFIGMLAIHITTNDLIATGALPMWFLATVLLPKTATVEMLEGIVEDMHKHAEKMEMQIIGGHTEVTPYLDNPIIVGTAIGKTERYLTSGGAKPGDLIMMTNYVAVEGVAVIAYDYSELLIEKGIPISIVEKARQMIYQTTAYPAGKILLERFGEHIHAMHDPTEGGIFTALHELADASNVGLNIFQDRIPVDDVVLLICRALNLNPFLLLSSGVLLFTVEENIAYEIEKYMKSRGLSTAIIGKIIKDRNIRIVMEGDKEMPLPRQEKDEIWRLY